MDKAFDEDDPPGIEADPKGALARLLLRRIGYTLLGLFRSVTLRSEERRKIPGKDLMRDLYVALVSDTPEQLAGLPIREAFPALL